MSDSDTGGVGQAPPGPAARGRLRSPRSAAIIAVARAVCIAAGLVTASCLPPPDERPTTGASVVLACGLLTVALVFGWKVRAIKRSPYPRPRAVDGPAATPVLFLVLFAGTDALYFTLTTCSTVSMLPMAGGLLLVGVAARVPAGTVQAGPHRKRREAPAHPQSGTGHPEPEARS
ncbi:two pore domain potassium channel family protein [Streptomyces flaveolus]|uniref:Two pore domain potassium channel family protein n=1 Tax=Streptomyces flaveolus TaxID=67297 RepID=A0ABV1VJZ9_9ACTN